MTRDEIESMRPGKELDVLVAEKYLGWEWVQCVKGIYKDKPILVSPRDIRFDDVTYVKTDKRAKGVALSFVHPFSSDIEFAWQVVCHKNAHWEIARTANGFQATCLLLNEKTKQYSTGRMYAETAPLAICRAAIFVVT